MTLDKLIVFGKTCSKVTSDEVIDELGHSIKAVRDLHYEFYINQETDFIIEVIYTPAQTYSVIIGDVIGEECVTLSEAEENIKQKIFDELENYQKLMALVA